MGLSDGRSASNGVGDLGEITLDLLRATFPEWRVFRHSGAWWAVRAGVQAWYGPRSLLVRTLTAPDLTALAHRLCLQDWLGSLDDDELETVYRGKVLEGAP